MITKWNFDIYTVRLQLRESTKSFPHIFVLALTVSEIWKFKNVHLQKYVNLTRITILLIMPLYGKKSKCFYIAHNNIYTTEARLDFRFSKFQVNFYNTIVYVIVVAEFRVFT